MFKNYSSEYAANIAALAGFAVLIARMFGVEVTENDAVFAIGVLINVCGILYNLYMRVQRGDITAFGRRK
jgi:hypothetical protein